MEHDGNISARASTDEPALPSPPVAGGPADLPPDAPQFATDAEARAWWAGVGHGLRSVGRDEPGEAAAPEPVPNGHRSRVDGWLPWKKAQFLLLLVAGGIVADACAAVGMSVASAYALRNRRSGRAFGKMWDAILIHRARGRLADNNLARAMEGCVEQVLRGGVVVAERRRFDNRLSMAMLTRLDRLAESKDGEEAELLRALSESFDDYLEILGSGGDEQAFLETRRPREAAARPPGDRNGPARLASPPDWSAADPADIPVDDLDPNLMHEWTAEQRQRAELSHYLDWLDEIVAGEDPVPYGHQCPAAFDRHRHGIGAAASAGPEGGGASQASTSSTSRPRRAGSRQGALK
jgi:hypothetical protein